MTCNPYLTVLLAFVVASHACAGEAPRPNRGAVTIVCPADGPANARLAAKEIRRYVYLRTGELLPIAASGQGLVLKVDAALAPQEYRLRSDGASLTLSGGSDVALLYGAYAFAERMGVRFYLHGDVIPDGRIPFAIPRLDETRTPLFELRGIQPFHDFPEGPDWWNEDDYLAYAAQLAKLRMNFLGLHCYPEGGVGPEPLVWIGLTRDLAADGRVKFSYPAFWANTAKGTWGYAPMRTSEFAGGASLLFPADDYGPDVMAGLMPRPVTVEQCNELFDRVGRQMGTVFSAARRLGIKTCIGTETPLSIPQALREYLKQRGQEPTHTNTVRALYSGMFQRIAQVSPVDYYWLWTPEDWTWGGNKPEQLEATLLDLRLALGALEDLGRPFTLATSGWVLGPAHDRAALDEFLPKTSPMSCINRQVGHDGVEPAFANVTGRPKWAIPWMENDPNMVGPQPWVARMRYDAVDARRFGCTGLLGIHWRTKALAMNVAALAAAAWDQSWVPAGFDANPVQPSRNTEGALGGNTAHFTAPVADAAVPAVYQNVRYDLAGYTLNLPDGDYTVTLQFNEPHYTAAGQRVFGGRIQGRQVFSHLDVFARAGQNRALDMAFPEIAVTNGTLRIEFLKEVEFPCIAGIIISGQTRASNQLEGRPFTRRINCGGEPVADYEADRVSGGFGAPSPRDRAMPIDDFYQDFARANFGPAVAGPASRLMAKMDGLRMPAASDWKNGPGNLVPNPKPWSEEKLRYAFVDEFAALRPQVEGAGNLDRFDYWLDTWRAAAVMAEACCVRGQLDRAMAAKDDETALADRLELARVWAHLLSLQAALVRTPGELGTIANLEQHTRKESRFLEEHDPVLSETLGKPLPAEAAPSRSYTGPPRLIVPTVRTTVRAGESLALKVIVLDPAPPRSTRLHLRPLGRGSWREFPVSLVSRAVHAVTLPAAQEDFEYYLTAETASGGRLLWPPTAPQLSQTVVVTE
jgi:hypothetical protein